MNACFECCGRRWVRDLAVLRVRHGHTGQPEIHVHEAAQTLGILTCPRCLGSGQEFPYTAAELKEALA